MEWTQDTVSKGFGLYVALSKKGFLTSKEDEYFQWYEERVVQDFIRKVIEPTGKVMIFLDEQDGVIQMVPQIENETMSYTNEDLKKELVFKDNKDIHLFYFILFILISELEQPYDMEFADRMYLPMDELLDKMNGYIEQYERLGEEKLKELSDKYDVDVAGIIEAWGRMADFKEGATSHIKTKDNRRMYIEKTLSFLEKEKLIRIREHTNISVTNKMKNVISHYYHNVANKSKIHDLLLVTKEGTVGEEEE
ncbi:DUF6063 family protein [Bacillus velezensis]|uniref:DUF6063 family protein n=1 Tax=Bacillus velezensis TaxID=492670 RepID=UPI00192AD51B|nr:DUF6063 family protein [Bacillus velezensis]MBL4956119.1 hypothetical protein [Bacillus velezensis]MCM3105137.1 DUF6063 family protein [Bacillus velezensis]MDQ9148232.1 DUF6063 family protein [Bacillus velezensis]MEC2185614.1 DUF6063 family protein [Bacillus velezensis]MED3449856.1 DUF6063 family protein [Bacillus velezensis]